MSATAVAKQVKKGDKKDDKWAERVKVEIIIKDGKVAGTYEDCRANKLPVKGKADEMTWHVHGRDTKVRVTPGSRITDADGVVWGVDSATGPIGSGAYVCRTTKSREPKKEPKKSAKRKAK